jgi:Ferric reductase like transmembrane component
MTALWYLTRGTGVVSLVLLTCVVVLGVTAALRVSSERWPRFLVAALHRNLTLLALAFLGVHIATTVADSYAPVSLQDAVVPFVSAYRPVWVGLGAVAFDLLLALVVTSLLRARVGARLWRALHWLACVSWPVALLHGLGTGSDARTAWMMVLTGVCIGAVALAVVWRAGAGGGRPAIRIAAAAAALALPVATAIRYRAGPLRHGWATRAGTPASLLSRRVAPAATPVSHAFPQPPFDATLRGRFTQTAPDSSGLVLVEVAGTASTGGQLDLKLRGAPLPGGGVQMQASSVAFGPYTGRITALQGTQVSADLRSGSGARLGLALRLSIDGRSGAVTGSLHASASGAVQ